MYLITLSSGGWVWRWWFSPCWPRPPWPSGRCWRSTTPPTSSSTAGLLQIRHAGLLQIPLSETKRSLLLVQAVQGYPHVHIQTNQWPLPARASTLQRYHVYCLSPSQFTAGKFLFIFFLLKMALKLFNRNHQQSVVTSNLARLLGVYWYI